LPEYRDGKKGFSSSDSHSAIQIEGIEHKKTNGPGKLCRFLNIDRKLNGWNLTKGEKLWMEPPTPRLWRARK